MDSGDDIFLTQNSFREEKNYDTDSVIEDILSMENTESNFSLGCNLLKEVDENTLSDDDLLQATLNVQRQEIEEKGVSQNRRFSEPLSEQAVHNLLNDAVPKNTQKKSLWAFNLLCEWLKERKIQEDVMKMSNENLNDVMGRFITEIKTKNGLNYRPNTLYEIVVSIQHHFRHNGRFINILDDAEFGKLRQILDAKMKENVTVRLTHVHSTFYL